MENIHCGKDKFKFLKKINKGKHLLICKDINDRFKEYAIITSDKEVKDTIKQCEEEPIEMVKYRFKLIYLNLTKYSDEELNKHYEEKDQIWQDWCNDVVLFYAHRFVIFNGRMLIPLMEMSDKIKIHKV